MISSTKSVYIHFLISHFYYCLNVQWYKWKSGIQKWLRACVYFQLVSLIENNSVVIIRGATGSGKTTQLPQFILDHYNKKNAPCNIVVTQPRKIGATSIARWVAAQRKCTLGSLVGYQVRKKSQWLQDSYLSMSNALIQYIFLSWIFFRRCETRDSCCNFIFWTILSFRLDYIRWHLNTHG